MVTFWLLREVKYFRIALSFTSMYCKKISDIRVLVKYLTVNNNIVKFYGAGEHY